MPASVMGTRALLVFASWCAAIAVSEQPVPCRGRVESAHVASGPRQQAFAPSRAVRRAHPALSPLSKSTCRIIHAPSRPSPLLATKQGDQRELWELRFGELMDYRREHGDCNVPQSRGSLGVWVSGRRADFKRGKLSDERVARLEGIGFVWDPQEQEWLVRFDELTKYGAKNGHCNVPLSQGRLGKWVVRQRENRRSGMLSTERLDLLASIGFSWEPVDAAWMARYDELTAYKDGNGDCNVPCNQGQLGRWVGQQRVHYKKGTLRRERIELLESIGFEWVLMERSRPTSSKFDELWKTKYTELVHYRIEHGTCNVPRKYGPLGRWVLMQRESYKDGSMSQFRRNYLDSIGFVWTTKRIGNEWHPDQYSKPDPEAIARIIEDERPRQDDLPSEALKTRVDVGRRLAEALEEYLDSDLVRLQPYDEQKELGVRWKTRYTELVRHCTEHGYCKMPRKYGPLFSWVHEQRKGSREGRLSQLRKEYLESIGFVWTTKRVGKEWYPDQFSTPDLKAIAQIIDDEKPEREDLPSGAPESLKMRVKVDRDLVKALKEYLAKLESDQ